MEQKLSPLDRFKDHPICKMHKFNKISSHICARIDLELKDKIIVEAKKVFPNEKSVNGFSAEYIALLKYNQYLIKDTKDAIVPDENGSDFEKILNSFSLHKLVYFNPMTSPTELIMWARCRRNNDSIVNGSLESDSLCCKVRKETDSTNMYGSNSLTSMVYEIEQEIISDLVNNSGTICVIDNYPSLSKIKEIHDVMDEKTLINLKKWILYPPEMYGDDLSQRIKIGKHLHQLPSGDLNYDVYVSRYIPADTILTGYYPDEFFYGYIVAPYILVLTEEKIYDSLIGSDTFKSPVRMMRYAKKLCREGAKYFATIKIKR